MCKSITEQSVPAKKKKKKDRPQMKIHLKQKNKNNGRLGGIMPGKKDCGPAFKAWYYK